MAAEPERVLRAAAKVAAGEAGTGVVEQAAAIHVTINGNPGGPPYECILDTAGKFTEFTEASPPEVARARLHLTYASEEVFLGLAHERVGPRAAMLTGKLKFRGEMSLGIKLGHWIRKAMALEAAAPDRLQAVDRGKWQRDEDAKRCAVCRRDFTVLRWRHHCRFCGRVVCEDCSASKVDGQRACESCLPRADPSAAEKRSENLAEDAPPSGGFRRDRQKLQQQDEKEGEAARELQTRVLELEEEIDHIDKRAFSARARVLRHLVLMVYRLISLGLLAMVLLSAHLSATLLSRQFGPKLFEVTVDVTALSAVGARGARLASAVGDAAGLAFSHAAEALLPAGNATVSVPEVQGDGSDAAAAAGTGKDANVARGRGGDARVGAKVSPTTCAEGDTCVAEARDGGGGGVRSLEDAAAAAAAAATAAASAAAATAAAAAAAGGRSKGSWALPEENAKRRPPESKGQQRPQQDDEPGPTPPSGKLHLSLSLYWAVMALVVLCLTVHQRRSEGLILRRVKTFCLAGTAILALKMTKTLTQGMSSDESDDTWADVHKLLAPFVYQSILDVAGMWVKTGQYLSSRADVMPQPYLDELSKLQDAVPASPFEEVDETVREQLGRPLVELFATIDREALASASVAQVHRCKLKDGREAVIKVQHRRVRKLFLEDLRNINRLVSMVAWAEKEYDFRPIMNEWTKESHKELDFVCEAKNLDRIGAAMKRSELDVIVPELVPEFTRMKVVVMTFCEGFKVTDAKALAAVDIDREAVMRSVTESFAYQIHIDGLFNGDPHPGNILLQPAAAAASKTGGKRGQGSRAAVPVLLDWGLAKTLPDHLRIAFSRFIYAGCEHDFVSMLIAFEEIGIKLNRFDPAEDMHNIRFLLRDTQPATEAKQDNVQFHRRIVKKRGRGLKNPVDAYPGELLFFLRVHVLLRGLAARLQVRQRYMDIMAPYATKALREMVPVEERATQAVYPSPVLSLLEIKVRKLLEGLVERRQITGCQVCVIYRGQTLVDLCAGTQGPVDPRPVRPSTLFCVFSAGKAVCSTAVHLLADRGLLRYDQRLSELWPEFASNGKLTTTVRHVLTHSTGLQHAFPDKATFDKVCDWGEVQRTLEDAQPAWPPGSRASYHYFTFGWLVAAVVERVAGVPFGKFVRDEIATPLGLEDSFFMGGLSACGVEASRIAHVEHKFKIPGRSGVGLGSKEGGSESAAAGPGATKQDAADSGSTTTATTTTTSNTDSSSSSSGGGGGFSRKGVAVVGPEPSLDSSQHAAADDVIVGTEDIDEGLDDDGAPRLGLLATMASALMEDDPDEGAAIDGLARKLAGREYFLDPRVFNYPQMRDACIPAANGHMSAKALATLYDNFLVSLGLSGNAKGKTSSSGRRRVVAGPSTAAAAIAPAKPPPLLCRARVNEMRAYQVKETSSLHLFFGLPMGGVRYSLGYQMFGFREKPKPQQLQRQHEPASAASSRASTTSSIFGTRRRLSENTNTLLGGGSTTGSTLFSRAASLFGGGESDDGTVPLADAAAAPAARGRVRLSGLGHVGMGGSVALCDPASGLAFAMVTNKVATGRECSTAVLSLVCEELGIGDPSHFFED